MGKLVSIVMTCFVVLSSRVFLVITVWVDGSHDGPSGARRTVAGSRFKTLKKFEIGYWKSTLWTSWRNGRTDRHRRDGPSQIIQWKLSLWPLRRPAGRTVAGTTGRRRLRNPSLGQISLHVLRDVLDYSYFNYKVSGFMLISLITWGLKEVTLS